MPDTDAERARRSRAHRGGDHSACSPARCPAARGGEDGPVAVAVAAMLAGLPPPRPGDPQHVLRAVLAGAAAAWDAGCQTPAQADLLRRLAALCAADPWAP